MKLVIDAGHGGKDPGAVGNGLQEKDLTLAIALKIGNMLSNYENVEVHYTRTNDTFVELSERAAIANRLNADYFLSVHINSGGGTGFESYVYTNVDAKTVAFQNTMHQNILQAIGPVADRGKKRADYAVLRETKMAAILTENLFIDNAGDASKLKSDAYLNQIALGHVYGLASAFGLHKGVVTPEVPKTTPTPAKQPSKYPVQPVSTGNPIVAQVRVIVDNLNCRQHPDVNSPVLFVAKKGQIYNVTANVHDWHEVIIDNEGHNGYLFGNNGTYLSLVR